MRNAAGQRADGFHLLRLQELTFQQGLLLLGLTACADVGDHGQRTGVAALVVHDGAHGNGGPQCAAIGPAQAQVALVGLARPQAAHHFRGPGAAAGLVQAVQPGATLQVLCRALQHAQHLGVGECRARRLVDQPDTFVGRLHDAAIAFGAVTQFARHATSCLGSPLACRHQHPGQQGGQHAQTDTRHRNDPSGVPLVAFLERRGAAHVQRPGAAAHVQVFPSLQARHAARHTGLPRAVDAAGRARIRAVVNAHIQPRQVLAIKAGHQISHPERRDDPAAELALTFTDRGQPGTIPVQGQHQQKSRPGPAFRSFRVLPRTLGGLQRAGQGYRAGVPRLHQHAPEYRVGQQVLTQLAQARTLTGSHEAQLGLFRPSLGRFQTCVGQRTQTRKISPGTERPHVMREIIARDFVGGLEKAAQTAQHLLVTGHARLDARGRLAQAEVEVGAQVAFLSLALVPPQPTRQGQQNQAHGGSPHEGVDGFQSGARLASLRTASWRLQVRA